MGQSAFPYGYFTIALLWVGYYALHSLLAAETVKALLIKRLPFMKKHYRMFYNVIAIITLIPVLLAGAVVSGPRLLPENNALRYVAMFFATWGVIVIRLAFKEYDFRQFAGLENEKSDDKLKKSGILGKIRHPIYAGGLLIVIGYALFAPTVTNLIICAVSVAYIFIGMRIEEKKLIRQYGQAYLDYMKEVPALIPGMKS